MVKNCSPTSAKDALKLSIALRYLPDADSVTAANSRSATEANSPVEAFIRSNTCKVWLPCLPKFSNKALSLENWNLPNNCSIACCFCSGSKLSSAPCNAINVPVRLPALLFTIPKRSIPNA